MASVRRAVILAGGRGTRFLPASKAVPKELFPVLDKPLLQYAIEEAAAAGIYEFVIVDAPGKEAIRRHLLPDPGLNAFLRERNRGDLVEKVQIVGEMAEFRFVQQDRPLGVADAVRCARSSVSGEPFALMFPDDLILGPSCIGELAEVFEYRHGAVVAVERVPRDEISQYGVAATTSVADPAPISRLVEKPRPEEAPSDLGVVGRYVLGPTIFQHIENMPMSGGEYQLTDALQLQIDHGERVLARRFSGRRFDAGRPAGLLAATVALAMGDPDLRRAVVHEVEVAS